MNNIIHIRKVMPVLRRQEHVARLLRHPAVTHNAPRLVMQWSICRETKRLTACWHANSPDISDESAHAEPGVLRCTVAFSREILARRLRYG